MEMDGARYYRALRNVQDPQEGQVTPAPFEYLVTCPVDKGHQILNTHLMVHIIKCRKAKQQAKGQQDGNTDVSMEYCRFNHAHFMRSDDIHCHELDCPDRFGMYKYTSALNEVTDSSEETEYNAEAEPSDYGKSTSLMRITSTQDLLRKIRLDGLGSQDTLGTIGGYQDSQFGNGTTNQDNDDAESTTSTLSDPGEQLSDVNDAKEISVTTGTASSDVFNDSTGTSQSVDLSDDSMSFRRGSAMGRLLRYRPGYLARTPEPIEQFDVDDDDQMWDIPKAVGPFSGRNAPFMFRIPPKMATKKEKKEDREQAAERFQQFLEHRKNNNQDGKFVTKFILTPPAVGKDWVDPELTFDEKDIPRWWDPTGRKRE